MGLFGNMNVGVDKHSKLCVLKRYLYVTNTKTII